MARSEYERRGEARLVRPRLPLALAAAILISLSACGGGAPASPTPAASPSAVPSPVEELAPTTVITIEPIEAPPPLDFEPTDKPVETTASGLMYIDLEEGTGPQPRTGQTVAVQYTGWLTNGTRFDSSWDRGQPLTFPLGTGNVIPGWEEGVSTMKVGGKRRLIIPPNLAYGASGNGPIPPNATIVFDVDLVAITG